MADSKQNDEVIKTLICLADSLDHEDKSELAEEVDKALSSFAARPKAPLKGLDDHVKENLIKFLVDSRDNLSHSVNNVEEFFRRLKYFGVDSIIKDIGLDKMLVGLKGVHTESEEAVRRFYELTHGRKPGKNDLGKKDEMPEQDAKDFFADKPTSEGLFGRDEQGQRQPNSLDIVKCEDCGEDMPLSILKSAAGFYLGRQCSCGPYSRDSGYFKTEEEAKKALEGISDKLSGKEEIKEDAENVPTDEEISPEELQNFWEDINK